MKQQTHEARERVIITGPMGPREVESSEVFVRDDGTLFILVGGLNSADDWVETEVTVAQVDIHGSAGEA